MQVGQNTSVCKAARGRQVRSPTNQTSSHGTAPFMFIHFKMHSGKHCPCLSRPGNCKESEAVVNRMKSGGGAGGAPVFSPWPGQLASAFLSFTFFTSYLHQEVINSCQAMSSPHIIFLVPFVHQWSLCCEVSLSG